MNPECLSACRVPANAANNMTLLRLPPRFTRRFEKLGRLRFAELPGQPRRCQTQVIAML
jgi:hypothetical protein